MKVICTAAPLRFAGSLFVNTRDSPVCTKKDIVADPACAPATPVALICPVCDGTGVGCTWTSNRLLFRPVETAACQSAMTYTMANPVLRNSMFPEPLISATGFKDVFISPALQEMGSFWPTGLLVKSPVWGRLKIFVGSSPVPVKLKTALLAHLLISLALRPLVHTEGTDILSLFSNRVDFLTLQQQT